MKKSKLEVEVTDHAGHAIKEEVEVLLSQNIAQFGNSIRLKGRSGAAITGEVPVGSYTLQALAKEYEAGREFIEIHADRTTKTSVRLKKGEGHPRLPVTERLEKRYGIKLEGKPSNLTIAEKGKVSLNYRRDSDGTHLRVLHPKSLSDLKRWVGSPEGTFVGKHPRFGPLPPIAADEGAQASLNAVAREYVYGNAQAVPAAAVQKIDSRFSNLAILVPIFFFWDVFIYDGATLEIGNGSSVFVCNNLIMFPSGTLSAVGDVRADIGTVQQL